MISIRGAIVAEHNTRETILLRTKELLEEIIKTNTLELEDIVSIIFTTTKDLTAVYPAVAAREIGVVETSLLCVQEMYVENSMEMCVRVLLHVNSNKKQKEAKHIYLNGAESLRPDIAK
jgi:monofunctional chorismate mutase